MKSNSVEQTIEEISEDINVAERFEQGLHKTVEDKIPVDIEMSIGGKGVPGASGPVGFQVSWALIVGVCFPLFLYSCVPYRIIELNHLNLRDTLWIFLGMP
jgi:hypothetical protein